MWPGGLSYINEPLRLHQHWPGGLHNHLDIGSEGMKRRAQDAIDDEAISRRVNNRLMPLLAGNCMVLIITLAKIGGWI